MVVFTNYNKLYVRQLISILKEISIMLCSNGISSVSFIPSLNVTEGRGSDLPQYTLTHKTTLKMIDGIKTLSIIAQHSTALHFAMVSLYLTNAFKNDH